MPNIADTERRIAHEAVVTGVRLPFCAMNAAGSAATAAEVRALARSRTGAIVFMTATAHPFVHPSFRSLHNPGFDKLLPLVRDLAASDVAPVVASVTGASPDEFGFLAKAFADAGAAVIEADLSNDWVASTLAPFEDAAVLDAIARRLVEASPRPVWVKLPARPPVGYAPLVDLFVDAGVRGLVAYNDFHGFEKLLLEAPRPIDVVVGGGIGSGWEVARILHKGARAVQVGRALRAEGPGVFARLERELAKAAG